MLSFILMTENEFRKSAILSSDLAGLSNALEKSGGAALDLLLWQRDMTTRICRANGGRLIVTTGEACLFDFQTPVEAIRSALEMRKEFDAKKNSGSTFSCALRIGIEYGNVNFFEGAALGDTVDIANRLRLEAAPGAIRVSGRVNDLLSGQFGTRSARIGVLDRGEGQDQVPVFEIGTTGPSGSGKDRISDDSSGRVRENTEQDGSLSVLSSIRRAILEETRSRGVRMSIGEARAKYGYYGVEALDVIASLADSGILVRDTSRSPLRRESSETEIPRLNAAKTEAESTHDYGYHGGDLGKSIESAVHSIVSEIERAVGESVRAEAGHRAARAEFGKEWGKFKGPGDIWTGSRHEWKEARREFREARHHARESSRHGTVQPKDNSQLGAYRDVLRSKAKRLRRSLIGNIISYSVINSVLWSVNITLADKFPWAMFVSIFWGLGVVDNIVSAIRLSRQSHEADSLPEMSDGQLSEYKAINKRRDALGKHFLSTLSISAILFLVNTVTSPGSPWFIIPSGILLVSFIVDAISYVATVPPRIKRFFASIGIKGGRRALKKAHNEAQEEFDNMGPYLELYKNAKNISRELEEDFAEADPEGVEEIKPELESYLGQVKLLSQTANELDSIIGAMPMDSLKIDKAKLVEKMAAAPQGLFSEYSTSIAEIEKQEESFKALQEQREVIDLRLKSSVNKLRQLQMDLANTRASSTEDASSLGSAALDAVKSRTEELSRYIDALKVGKLETLEDPFAQLEREEAERTSKKT
jgi:hypothetical protein